MRVVFGRINWGGPLGMNEGVSMRVGELAYAGHERVVHAA
jgi:hypothetical protein